MEVWIIYSKKLDKWSFWDSIEGPGAPVSEEVALQCLEKLKQAYSIYGWAPDKTDDDQYKIWKFQI